MKILQVSMGLEFGGIEKMELSISRGINSSFSCDFLIPDDGVFDNYKDKINGSIYSLGCNRKNIFSKIKYYFKLNNFLKNNKYDVVHINSSVFLFSYQVLRLSKKYGYRVISHIHSTPKISKLKRILINILMPKYMKKIDLVIGCSEKALDCFCGDKYKNSIVLNNGIDINKYKFNNSIRKSVRSKYKLDGNKVYSYIGRFDRDKNIYYVIDLFNEILKLDGNSYLLLIGDLKELESYVEKLGIKDRVLFLGFREDVSDLLNGIDVSIYPSIREGFNLSIVEAETNGVMVYGSSNIVKDVSKNNFKYFDLDDDIIKNASMIVNDKINIDRKNSYKFMGDFDIDKYCKTMERIYEGDYYED